jgi:hypothetical protein
MDWEVERWYELVKPYTFRYLLKNVSTHCWLTIDSTVFLPFPRETAIALINAREKHTTPEQDALLEQLKVSIDEAMSEFDGAFVRLSTLSPKDGTKANLKRVDEMLKEEMSNATNPSEDLMALNRTLYLASRVNNGEEAINL